MDAAMWARPRNSATLKRRRAGNAASFRIAKRITWLTICGQLTGLGYNLKSTGEL